LIPERLAYPQYAIAGGNQMRYRNDDKQGGGSNPEVLKYHPATHNMGLGVTQIIKNQDSYLRRFEERLNIRRKLDDESLFRGDAIPAIRCV
jgi:hypothetical protein